MTQPTPSRSLEALQQRLRVFARERDWEKFHSPKNISMALIVEAAELLEHFQWLTEGESAVLSAQQRAEVTAEMADVFIYLVRLSDILGVDLWDAAYRKIEINAAKYPAGEVRGQAHKR